MRDAATLLLSSAPRCNCFYSYMNLGMVFSYESRGTIETSSSLF